MAVGIPEALLNGANTMLGISNAVESIMENGIRDAIAKQLGAAVTLYKSKKSFEYQTEGQGGFYGGAKISIVSKQGNAIIGVNIYDMPYLSVKAQILYLENKALHSKFKAQSISVTTSVSLAGDVDLGADYQADSGFSTSQVQHYMWLGVLNLDVDKMHIRGTLVRCQDIMGRVPIIETEDKNNYSYSKHEHYGASCQGNVSFSNCSTKSETHGAIGQLQVANGINNSTYNLDCQQHINHGMVGILTDNPENNKLKVTHEQHNQVLQSKRHGGGMSTNVSEQGLYRPSKISIDFLSNSDAVTQDGLQIIRYNKFKANATVPTFYNQPNINLNLLYDLEREIYYNNQIILGEYQYPHTPVLDKSPLIFRPVNHNDLASISILDEQFLAKPGFEYIQPEPMPIISRSNIQPENEIFSYDSYSEENIRKYIDEFITNPMNIGFYETRSNTKNIALNISGSIAGMAQSVILDAVEFIDTMELPYIMATGFTPHGGKKFQKAVNAGNETLNELDANGPMPLFVAYRDMYESQIKESARYANNNDPFMAGFAASRARTGVALDAATLISLGAAAVKAVPIAKKLGANAYNVATMGKSTGRATNSVLVALEGEVNPKAFSQYNKATFTPGYDNKRTVINDSSYVNTGARSYSYVKHGDAELWATPIYEDIRSWNGAENIATISKNTGIPEQMIASVRQHLFFDEHKMPVVNEKTGRMTTVVQRFSPDFEIAELWDLASSQPISGIDLIKFERLIAHEYIERGLMKIGYPYRSFDSDAIEFIGGRFRLGFNKYNYGAHDIAPLTCDLTPPWQHYKKIGGFEPLPSMINKQKLQITD